MHQVACQDDDVIKSIYSRECFLSIILDGNDPHLPVIVWHILYINLLTITAQAQRTYTRTLSMHTRGAGTL